MNKKVKQSILDRFIEFAFTREIDILDYKILAEHFIDQDKEDEPEEDLQKHIDKALKKLNIP